MASDRVGLNSLAMRYASALFSLSEESNSLESVDVEINAIQSLIGDNKDFMKLINSPIFNREDQFRGVSSVCTQVGFSKITRNFLCLITKNRRLFLLPEIIISFQRMISNFNGEIAAEVTVASRLDDHQTRNISEAMQKTLGSKVKVTHKVDKNILGGLVVRVGSRMFDNSLRTKLQRLGLAMKGA